MPSRGFPWGHGEERCRSESCSKISTAIRCPPEEPELDGPEAAAPPDGAACAGTKECNEGRRRGPSRGPVGGRLRPRGGDSLEALMARQGQAAKRSSRPAAAWTLYSRTSCPRRRPTAARRGPSRYATAEHPGGAATWPPGRGPSLRRPRSCQCERELGRCNEMGCCRPYCRSPSRSFPSRSPDPRSEVVDIASGRCGPSLVAGKCQHRWFSRKKPKFQNSTNKVRMQI